ncbi:MULTISPECIES: S1 family peptidase [unclassified Streptomyces]|uniref:S1 family peptidase n=1 Tax=unclassified Streptomyces TaxID=2593676 RepID=UPI00136FAC65|nr:MULTISPECIES: serine protease [unclassified Streptomyces]MCW5253967.1 trypsin-like peptidase domain-containing protein [Streptomyces sp. SHP 1-2]MYU25681.1 serine protease [Streptomyces sp. SID8352]
MKKPLLAVLATLALTGLGAAPAIASSASSAPASSAPAPAEAAAPRAQATSTTVRPAGAQAVSFAGTVALSNCSGALVRLPSSGDNDPGLVMSNGHCLETGFPAAGQVLVDRASSRTFSLLNAAGTRVATLRAAKLAYGTMTDTDVSLYQLTSTYAQIRASSGISPLTLSDTRPAAGTAITVVSGYWTRTYSCSVDGFAYRLKEGQWTWKDSIRYTSACQTIGGTSGSPVVDNATGKVVAVNNTGNEDGARCTDNNPCEVAADGTVTVRRGINYAQQSYQIPGCFGTGNKLDLTRAGCALPKP